MTLTITIKATGIDEDTKRKIIHDMEARIKEAADQVLYYLNPDAELIIKNNIK